MRDSYLQVSPIHKIFYKVSGQKNGIPVLHIHGGPGSRSKPEYLDRFDKKLFKIIQFDQRGCGKSEPQGEVKENTTQDLLDDIEKLRKHLKINRWIVAGGSWGSTLALLYAEQHPTKVMRLFLNSIFLGRKKDVAWLTDGARKFYPDIYEDAEKILKQLNLPEDKITQAYMDIFKKGSIKEIRRLIIGTSIKDDAVLNFAPVRPYPKPVLITKIWANSARIYLNYIAHKNFIEEGQILNNINKIKRVPLTIVHARYDMCCTPDSAFDLHKATPWSKLFFIEMEGHRFSAKSDVYLKNLLKELVLKKRV